MRVIVLGAKGQLGTELVELLTADGHEVVSVTRDHLNAGLSLAVSQLDSLPTAPVIINCIAYVKVDDAEADEAQAMKVNAEFPAQLAEFCAQTSRLLIHFSTDYVFSGSKKTPYEPDDSLDPINVYGRSKAAGEIAIRKNAENYLILRVSGLYGRAGSSGKGGNFVETMLKLAKTQKTVRVVNDQMTSPTYCRDVAAAVSAILASPRIESGTYHCANTGVCSWFEFAQEIFSLSGFNVDVVPISSYEFNSKARRPSFSALSSARSEGLFQMKNWQDGLRRYLIDDRRQNQ